jgi:hypothetical protein
MGKQHVKQVSVGFAAFLRWIQLVALVGVSIDNVQADGRFGGKVHVKHSTWHHHFRL